MEEIVVVGSLMIDLVSVTDRVPKSGETVHGKSFVQNFGGKGANQCVAAHRLGSKSAMIGNIGDDQYGSAYKKELQNSGIDTNLLEQVAGESTGIASIWVDKDGQNSIIITANANSKWSPQRLQKLPSAIKKCKMLLCQLEVPQQVSLLALQLAKENGVRSIFNPAPAPSSLPDEFFNYLDIICLNESEAELFCGFAVDTQASCQKAISALLTRGAAVVIITRGEKGVVFASKDQPDMQTVTTDKVKVVDSTGAGDAFVGALAHFLLAAENEKVEFETVVWRAAKYAADSVQKSGTQPSYAKAHDLPPTFFHR